MTCDACTAAKVNPRLDRFTNGCTSCQARALAAIGAHIESAELGAMTAQYRTALEKVFGEAWKQGHDNVKEWSARIESASKRKVTS